MKHIIPYKKEVDYKIDIFTIDEASNFYSKFIKKNNYYGDDGYERYNLKKKFITSIIMIYKNLGLHQMIIIKHAD